MRAEKEIRKKLEQIEDAIESELKYEVNAPKEYYQMRNILKWVLDERDTL